jgi:hypothetical protein
MILKLKSMIPLICIIFASLLAIVSAFNDYHQKLQEKEEEIKNERLRNEQYANLLKKSNNLLETNTKVINNQNVMLDTAGKIVHLQNELIDKNNELSALQTSTYNQITGGGGYPILKLFTTKPLVNGSPKKTYFLILFDVLNSGEFPLQGLKFKINDIWGRSMLKFGVKHTRNGNGAGFEGGERIKAEEISYKPFSNLEIGTISPNISYPAYTTTFSQEVESRKDFGYSVDLQWNNGSAVFFINLYTESNYIRVSSIEVVLNGKLQPEYSKYFQLKNQVDNSQ